MILDLIQNRRFYIANSHDIWQRAFDFILSVNAETKPDKYIFDGDLFFAFVQEFETKPVAEGIVEIHHQYIDIHAVVQGRENIFYTEITALRMVKDYTPESDDVVFEYNSRIASQFQNLPGRFAIFFPGEGHMPGILMDNEPEYIKKIVVKIHNSLAWSTR
ncbi:MAG: YhcH/YjgK/YiaL family protein [Chitinophagaceae bacterium]|nr:YhcH/YjgK/YiaL family protein [Chitinophagaceae bacterium]